MLEQKNRIWEECGMSESEMRAKLDHILKAIEKIETVIERNTNDQRALMIWRATVEEQLRQGTRSFAELRLELANKLDKKIVLAYMAGAAGGAAALVRLLGG